MDGSYEQEAAAVVEDGEEVEREDDRGVAKRPDLGELDVLPEWAEGRSAWLFWGKCKTQHRTAGGYLPVSASATDPGGL
jgi:hypothetical protein